MDLLREWLHGDRDAENKRRALEHRQKYGTGAVREPGINEGFDFFNDMTDRNRVDSMKHRKMYGQGLPQEEPLIDEGLLDILRPTKDNLISKADESGVPSWLSRGIDMLTPDGLDPFYMLSKAKKIPGKLDMVSKKKYKPGRYNKINPDPELELDALDDYVGNVHYHDIRAAQMAGDTPTPWDGEIAGLKNFVESNKKVTRLPLERSENLTEEELLDILTNDELISPRMISATDAKGGKVAGGGIVNRSNVKYRIAPGTNAADATKINPGEREWFIPEGEEFIVTNRDFDGDQFVFDVVPKSKLGKQITKKVPDDYSPWESEFKKTRKQLDDEVDQLEDLFYLQQEQKLGADEINETRKRLAEAEKRKNNFYYDFERESGIPVVGTNLDLPETTSEIKYKAAPSGLRENYDVRMEQVSHPVFSDLIEKDEDVSMSYKDLAKYLGRKSDVDKSRNEDIAKVKRWAQKEDENIKDAAQYGLKIPPGPTHLRAKKAIDQAFEEFDLPDIPAAKQILIKELNDRNQGGFTVSKLKEIRDNKLPRIAQFNRAFDKLAKVIGDRVHRLAPKRTMMTDYLQGNGDPFRELVVELNHAGFGGTLPMEEWKKLTQPIKDYGNIEPMLEFLKNKYKE